MTPRDEIRAYLEKLKALDSLASPGPFTVDYPVGRKPRILTSVGTFTIATTICGGGEGREVATDNAELLAALRNLAPVLIEMAERAMECGWCNDKGYLSETVSEGELCNYCAPRVTRWAEQIEKA